MSRELSTVGIRRMYSCATSWRLDDDLEGGDTDLSQVREQQAAEFDRWLEQHDSDVAKAAEERIIKRFTELKTYPTGAFQYTELAMLCTCDGHCIDENDFIALIKGKSRITPDTIADSTEGESK